MEPKTRATALLRTKLFAPRLTSDHVSRGRLLEALDQSRQVPLTLVSAPAGYGKSLVVSEWCERQEQPFAWVSLDEGDGDLRVFLGYLVAAVHTVHPGACRPVEELLELPELPPLSELARELVNDLAMIEEPSSLVLDDLHRIDRSSPVYELLNRLLEHPPRNVHLVLITRQDPPLPLVSLRARNVLRELRLHDLRFTAPETAQLLSVTKRLAVGDDALANLHRELEGWPAGLRLVLLALPHAGDPDSFLENLHGGLPQTQEYLFREVLSARPPEVREFMLRSSILDRFCPDVLDAVCRPAPGEGPEPPTGRSFLALMQRDNLFTNPLGAEGEWFCYHHLFQLLLQRELHRQNEPGEIASLHARASVWFEGQDLIEEALVHAAASGDSTRAAEVLERHRWTELDQDRWFVVERWLALLPVEVEEQRLELLLSRAWIHWYTFQIDLIPPILERSGQLVDTGGVEPSVLAELDFFRGAWLYWQGKAKESRQCCENALARLSTDRGVLAGELRVYLALSRHMAGDGAAAAAALNANLRGVAQTENVVATRLFAAKAYLHLLSGDLASTVRAARRIVTVTEAWPSTYARQWGYFIQALAQLHAYQLEEAVHGFLTVAVRKLVFERRAAVDALVGAALAHQLAGEPDRALSAAEELIVFARDQLQCVHSLALAESARARIALLQGDLELALEWANASDEEIPAAEMIFWLEQPSITRARVQIAHGSVASLQTASDSLGRLRRELEALHLNCHTIEVAVLQALALEKQGSADPALVAAREAVDLARAGGWIRPFVEAGHEMVGLLTRLDAEGEAGTFVRQVLAALGHERGAEAKPTPAGRVQPPARAVIGDAVDGLTNRELDVIELLARRLQNKEIAEELFISNQTVSYHLKHIYHKLGVHGRRQAIVRAREKGILPLA